MLLSKRYYGHIIDLNTVDTEANCAKRPRGTFRTNLNILIQFLTPEHNLKNKIYVSNCGQFSSSALRHCSASSTALPKAFAVKNKCNLKNIFLKIAEPNRQL